VDEKNKRINYCNSTVYVVLYATYTPSYTYNALSYTIQHNTQ